LAIFVLLLGAFNLKGIDALISGSGPSSRFAMGFESTPDGMVYVFGGFDGTGNQGNCGNRGARVM
jgi:hypothetical protein